MKKNNDLISEEESKKIITEILEKNNYSDDEYIEDLSEVELDD